MKIQVKDIGAIKDATIDLTKKLNIFCGPNGTGKTYMAYIIYALTNLENKNIGILLDKKYSSQIIENSIAEIELDINKLLEFRNKEIKKQKDNLWNIFAIPESKAEEFFKNSELNFKETQEEFENKLTQLEFQDTFKLYGYTFDIKKVYNTKNITLTFANDTNKDKLFIEFLNIALLSRVYSILAFYPIVSSTIFPVERNSIYTFSNELSIRKNDVLDHLQTLTNKKDEKDKNNISLLDLLIKRTTRYPQPIRDGLVVAEDLNHIQKQNSEYFDFATEIENELLNGKVIINKEGNVEFKSDKAKSIKLSFHQSSSIVKTLSSLVIYLKHIATKNDLVIIDEPELNLHPDNQVKLARIFARLVNKGLRLLISTHSDYIIREFNNLIILSSNHKEIRNIAEQHHYKQDEYITINDIAAYMFNYKNKHSKQVEVKPISIDKYGFSVDTFDTTIENLNTISDELYYTMKYDNNS